MIAGFAPAAARTFNYDVPSANTREKFWEAADLIVRSGLKTVRLCTKAVIFPPLCESLAQAVAAAVSTGLDSRLPQPVNHSGGRQTRLLLFSLPAVMAANHRAQQEFAAVLSTRINTIRSASAF